MNEDGVEEVKRIFGEWNEGREGEAEIPIMKVPAGPLRLQGPPGWLSESRKSWGGLTTSCGKAAGPGAGRCHGAESGEGLGGLDLDEEPKQETCFSWKDSIRLWQIFIIRPEAGVSLITGHRLLDPLAESELRTLHRLKSIFNSLLSCPSLQCCTFTGNSVIELTIHSGDNVDQRPYAGLPPTTDQAGTEVGSKCR